MLKLWQFQGEYFHHYLTRLQNLVDIRYSRGFQDSLRDMVLCVIEGMTPETRELAKSINNGSFAGLGVSGLWDLFCYMGDQSADEESYTSMFQPMEYSDPSMEDSISVLMEQMGQLREMNNRNEEAIIQLTQTLKELVVERCSTPQIDESQDASNDEFSDNGEEHLVVIDTKSQETSLEIEYVSMLPPFVDIIPNSPIKEPSPEPISVVPEQETSTFCKLGDFGEYVDPWSHYFNKPPAELCWWSYIPLRENQARMNSKLVTVLIAIFLITNCFIFSVHSNIGWAREFDLLLRALTMSA